MQATVSTEYATRIWRTVESNRPKRSSTPETSATWLPDRPPSPVAATTVAMVTRVRKPPSHCSSARKKMPAKPTDLTVSRAEAPVVVSPDTLSNRAVR